MKVMKRLKEHFSDLYEKMGPKKLVEFVIFNSKWLLIPFFLKLIFTLLQLLYIYVAYSAMPPEALINTLETLDIVMVACLVKMVMTGSYNSFVTKDHGYKGENLSSSSLKIKMGSSIIGVSSIDLLKVFVNIETMFRDKELAPHVWDIVWMKVIIHAAFIIGGFAMVYIGLIHAKLEKVEIEVEESEEAHEENNHVHEEHVHGEKEPISMVHAVI